MVSRIKQASATSGSQSLSSQDSGNRIPRKKRQPDSGFDANKGYKRQPHERTEKSRGTLPAQITGEKNVENHVTKKSIIEMRDIDHGGHERGEQEQQYNKRILSTSSKHNQKETEKRKKKYLGD